ncbi:MAG: hypothetical protein ABI353_11460 [Isosphaeraceae bacterium]
MGIIAGAIGLADSDRSFVNVIGQEVVYTATMAILDRYNEDLSLLKPMFIGVTNDVFKSRFKLPGGGYLQRRSTQGTPGSMKAYGGYDVAYPLEDFGSRISTDDVAMGYMRIDEWDRHVKSVFIQDANTVRFELMRVLLNNTARSFEDAINGTLSCQVLANNDSVTYPPVLGSTVDATENHYLVSNYVTGSISDVNNPLPTIRNEIEEHFGVKTGGENIAVLIHPDETAKIQALTEFVEVPDRFIVLGDNTAYPERLPSVPGRILGRSNGCWVSEWRNIPSGYLVGVHLEEDPPLQERIDPADTGLAGGLQLVARDRQYPFTDFTWRHRFGFAAKNRLNGVVMQLKASGSYDVPAGYSW